MSRARLMMSCWLTATCTLAQEATPAHDTVIDPTAPPPIEILEKRTPPLHLNAIMLAHNKPLAVINGKALSIGEQIDGATVQVIEKTRVQVEQAGEHQWLVLFQPVDVKQAASTGKQEK